ncbi:MAG: hypothetical protein JW822_01115 [Spirochaetales bacterium]|nr:hypothetical protein [Spirochaetales bacterium]
MEKLTNFIELHYTNPEINSLISQTHEKATSYTKHFNQTEDFFLKLNDAYTVPHLPIHHNISEKEPSSAYMLNLKHVMSQVYGLVPDVFEGLRYWFDAEEIHKPLFYKLYEYKRAIFLYLLRLDLSFRHNAHEVIEKGDNDITTLYRTRQLFLDAHMIPIEEVVEDSGHIEGFKIKQLISQTWIGERGRGYFVQGIWMDDDLTKFFSRLFIKHPQNLYPFYPYVCTYKTICQNVISLSSQKRAQKLSSFLEVLNFLNPHLSTIQHDLLDAHFSEQLPYFQNLKKQVPAGLYTDWQNLEIRVYLNENGMREFIVED